MAPRRKPTRRGRKSQSSSQNSMALYGRKLRVPANPPQFVYRPFSPLTVSVSLTVTGDTGSYTMFHTDIIKAAASQLGITVNSLRFKIVSVRLWNLTSKSLLVYFYEGLTDEGGATERSNHPLMYLEDTGSPMTYAAVGYHYPSSTTNNVFSQSDPQTTLYQLAGTKGDVILHRIHILYANT